MLILFDFECDECGAIEERLVATGTDGDADSQLCSECSGDMHQIIAQAPTYQHMGNQDTGWLKTIHEVIDKDNPAPHVQEMLRNPTRDNYHNWMKGEGISPLEPGEKPAKKEDPDKRVNRNTNEIMDARRKRRAITVSGV